MTKYLTEFPQFKGPIPDVFLKAPWADASWHNDACPSFSRPYGADGREIHVYVEEENPRLREIVECPRYIVRVTDEEGSYGDDMPSFAHESLAAVLDHIGFLVGEVAR